MGWHRLCWRQEISGIVVTEGLLVTKRTYTTLADHKTMISIRRLMNLAGTQCVMIGNAGHTDAGDSRTFGFPKSQTFCNLWTMSNALTSLFMRVLFAKKVFRARDVSSSAHMDVPSLCVQTSLRFLPRLYSPTLPTVCVPSSIAAYCKGKMC